MYNFGSRGYFASKSVSQRPERNNIAASVGVGMVQFGRIFHEVRFQSGKRRLCAAVALFGALFFLVSPAVAWQLTARMRSFPCGFPFNHENLIDVILKLTASVRRTGVCQPVRSVSRRRR